MAMKAHPIHIIGCGPGGVEYVTPLARKMVLEAEVLVGAQRLIDLFPESTATIRIPVKAHIDSVLDEMETLSKDKGIAVLVTGDPGLLSLAKPVIARFGRDCCRVIAGISSLQVAFASLGLDWYDALIIDAHGGLPEQGDRALPGIAKIAVFAGKRESFVWMAGLADRLGDGYRIFLCADLTLSEESIREIHEEDLFGQEHPVLSIVIFVRKELLE